ncbi:MAG: hypothetical protein HOP29_19615 [Phycisphaerales bacterium]|nr:hypothetical protein [Phycisphaerales bacterium]
MAKGGNKRGGRGREGDGGAAPNTAKGAPIDPVAIPTETTDSTTTGRGTATGRGRRGAGRKAGTSVADYRHESATRKNNPPAKIAAEGNVPVVARAKYAYSPHRPPVLRFDATGAADRLPELLEEAKRRPLTDAEARLLADALRTHQPWLEWAKKREQHERGGFEVDPVALHIHERVSAQAVLKVARRQNVQRSLWADPELDYSRAVQFYKHDIDWTNPAGALR